MYLIPEKGGGRPSWSCQSCESDWAGWSGRLLESAWLGWSGWCGVLNLAKTGYFLTIQSDPKVFSNRNQVFDDPKEIDER